MAEALLKHICGDVYDIYSAGTRPWVVRPGAIEAMASGVPVIGSDSGAIPEVIGDAGLVVPEGDVGALAEALRRLVSTPGLRTDLASRGRGRVLADYTNGIIARRLAAFWQDLVSDA